MWPVTWQNLILRYFFIPLHDDKWNIILIEKECLNFSNYPTEPNFFTCLKQKLTKSTNNSNLNFGASEGDKYKRYIIEWEYKSNNFFLTFIEFMSLRMHWMRQKKRRYKNNNLLPVTYYLCRLQKYFMNNISSAG